MPQAGPILSLDSGIIGALSIFQGQILAKVKFCRSMLDQVLQRERVSEQPFLSTY